MSPDGAKELLSQPKSQKKKTNKKNHTYVRKAPIVRGNFPYYQQEGVRVMAGSTGETGMEMATEERKERLTPPTPSNITENELPDTFPKIQKIP